MGLTAHNLKRRQMAAQGQTNQISMAESACRNARANVALLEHNLRTAERHLVSCEAALSELAPHEVEAPAVHLGPDFSGMTHKELQAECKALGLKAGGSKSDLFERLETNAGR